MTASLVLLAQTRVGFLSGGRGKSFRQLAPQEQAAQREEAFARATVAFTRAQQICLIMGPLDMRGLVGAATIMGCLKYGASFSGLDDQDGPSVTFPVKGRGSARGTLCLLAKSSFLLCESERSQSATGPC